MAEQKYWPITAGKDRGKYRTASGRVVSVPQVEAYRASKARKEKSKAKK